MRIRLLVILGVLAALVAVGGASEVCRDAMKHFTEAETAHAPPADLAAARAEALKKCAQGRDGAYGKWVRGLVTRCDKLTGESVEKCKLDAYRFVLWFEY